MRVAVRRQETRHPYNRCGCAVDRAVSLLREEVLYHARTKEWDVVRQLAESIPEQLLSVDVECGVNTQQFNAEIQSAIRGISLSRLSEAIAGVDLEICGQSVGPRGVEIPFEALEEAARRTEERERQEEALR